MWDMNLIYVENCGEFRVMAPMAVLWKSLMSMHQLRVENSLESSNVGVEKYLSLVIISHPNRQFLRH